MAEISDIQVLCAVLIIAVYFLVFITISNNWSDKLRRFREKLEAEKILTELISSLEKEELTKTYGKEIKLIPDLKEKRIGVLHESQIRRLVSTNVTEHEKELGLREAQ